MSSAEHARQEALGRVFRRGFAATFVFDIASRLISAATVVVLIRGLSVADYAFLTLFWAMAQFAGNAASGGVRMRYLREQAERFSRGSAADTQAFVNALLIGVVLVAAFGAVLLPFGPLLDVEATLGERFRLVAYATVGAAGLSASELVIYHYQAQKRFLAAGWINLIRASALLVAGAIVAVATEVHTDGVAAWLVGAMLLTGVGAVVHVVPRDAFRRQRSGLRLNGEEAWLTIYYLGSAGLAYIGILIAGTLLGVHDVASLGAAQRYFALVLGVLPALVAVMRVRTAQVDVVESVEKQKQLLVTWIRRTSLPIAAGLSVLAVLAPIVIPVIDNGLYPDSIPTFQVLLGSAFASYVGLPAASILMSQRRYTVLAALVCAALAFVAFGTVLIAPTFGVVGVAVVSTCTYVLLTGVAIVVVLRTPSEYPPEAAR